MDAPNHIRKSQPNPMRKSQTYSQILINLSDQVLAKNLAGYCLNCIQLNS
jgi:hypothetical protein